MARLKMIELVSVGARLVGAISAVDSVVCCAEGRSDREGRSACRIGIVGVLSPLDSII